MLTALCHALCFDWRSDLLEDFSSLPNSNPCLAIFTHAYRRIPPLASLATRGDSPWKSP
ncbi:hypothetical protein PGB90_003589 [Kerria lacca]